MTAASVTPSVQERLDRVAALRHQLIGAVIAAQVDSGIALSALLEAYREIALGNPERISQASQFASIVSMQLLMQLAPPEVAQPGALIH